MDGIADLGSVVGRVATCAFVRKESVPAEPYGGSAPVVDCGFDNG
jgi:hypothetical protein